MLDLSEVLRHRARDHGEDVAYSLYRGDGVTDFTYARLADRAEAAAAALRARGLAHHRVLLSYHDPVEHLFALFGCWFAGAVPVTIRPFLHYRPGPSAAHLLAVVQDATPRAILCPADTAAALRTNAALSGVLPQLEVIDDLLALPAGASSASSEHEALAHIQYTSGSTGTPRGAMVSHANLMACVEDICQAFEADAESVLVSWLPHYHDMGLIGGLLTPLYLGFRCALLYPMEFLRHPMRWLEIISATGATHSVAPNFGYELCATAAAKRPPTHLDLSRWRAAMVGAEPISPDTLDRFAAALAPAKFSKTAFVTTYGLAEATLKVSASPMGREPLVISVGADRRAISSGRIGPNEVRIVDPEAALPRPDGEEGEVWVRGPTVGLGYWSRPEESERVFRAHLATGEGPYLRTGDLGLLRDGELYITGRLKDLIILRGRNVYPQDLERTIERCHAAMRVGGAAAFSIPGDEEQVVVAAEIARSYRLMSGVMSGGADSGGLPIDPAELIRIVQAAVSEQHDVQVADVVLLKAGTLPRTPSGKVRRQACRAAYLDRTLATAEVP